MKSTTESTVEPLKAPSSSSTTNGPLLSPLHVIDNCVEADEQVHSIVTDEADKNPEVVDSVEERLVTQLPVTMQPIVREVVKLQSKLDNVVEPNTANAIRSGVNLVASLGLLFADMSRKSNTK